LKAADNAVGIGVKKITKLDLSLILRRALGKKFNLSSQRDVVTEASEL
jgi:hypothetical protein